MGLVVFTLPILCSSSILDHVAASTYYSIENFRAHLDQSLNRGEGFATSVRSCTKSCMLEFDQGCAGNVIFLN
ncbi:hypothetical protein CK203_058456 [Vitis vinifera]|uniref:Sey1/RHD3-like three-helix bundle domain-containing protein n=1 Tax=Vitis vinifera TaxID=29760 RepID=A0A438H0T8_VITVI|nr:hypothetical protein CK203_058456 [Vitis vinifera]